MKDFRVKLWHSILENLGPEPGYILPRWLIAVRCVIFPIETPRLFFFARNGAYDILTDQWTMYGVKYSSAFFYHMSRANGQTFKIKRLENSISLTSCEPEKS